MVIGGRNLAGNGPPARITVTTEQNPDPLDAFVANPGFFLQLLTFSPPPSSALDEHHYEKVSVVAPIGSHVAIEQFDVSSDRPVFGFGEGWYRQEYPASGLRWRWLSGRGEIRFHASPGAAVVLHLEGESPLRDYRRPSRLVIRVGERVVREETLSADFSFDTVIPSSWSGLRRSPSRSIPIRSMCRPNAVGEPAIDGAWACGYSSASCGRLPCRLPSEAQKRAAERAVEASQPGTFQQQESCEQRIDGSCGDRDFSLGMLFLRQPPPPLRQSRGEDGEEKCEIRVGKAHDCEANAGEQPAKPGAAIPS